MVFVKTFDGVVFLPFVRFCRFVGVLCFSFKDFFSSYQGLDSLVMVPTNGNMMSVVAAVLASVSFAREQAM